MKRIVVIIGILLFVLSGCSEEAEYHEPERVEVEQEEKQIEKEIKEMLVHHTSFLFIVDWLSNEEILFVEEDDDHYRIKTFHIYSKEIKNVYEAETMIVDVLIHPMKEYLLVHTSGTSSSATVKMLTLDGMIQNEIAIESVELAIEWNDLNPSSILFTAFYEDWSFDAFLFDGVTNHIQLLPIEYPFPKWLGTNHFVLMSDSLSGGEGGVVVYDVQSGEERALAEGHVLSYDTFEESILLVQSTEDEEAQYTILNVDLEVVAKWTMRSVKELSESLIPNYEWITEESLYIFRSIEDEASAYELVKYEDDKLNVFMNDLEDTALVCSPDAKKCLAGYGLEKIIDLENKTSINWLLYKAD